MRITQVVFLLLLTQTLWADEPWFFDNDSKKEWIETPTAGLQLKYGSDVTMDTWNVGYYDNNTCNIRQNGYTSPTGSYSIRANVPFYAGAKGLYTMLANAGAGGGTPNGSFYIGVNAHPLVGNTECITVSCTSGSQSCVDAAGTSTVHTIQ